jgi:acyl carrier protein
MTDSIRSIIEQHARLSVSVENLPDDADLYAAGLTSHATVNVMLAIEDEFGIEFPDRMMRRRSFESIAAIRAAVDEINGAKAAS